ncbi:Lipase (class 3) [Carpediemonas membranifera]|uniref:sn-1-specific diacylglycerol lipase n=1 Tax=Carpediemonas membranifera TaxID=201153 RepID=A0A8J6B5J9_9EUKA|nr:Lipase (class 3) [Carpediemonas membranifera]|eukprot:KAG9396123.1 Lipase (class 3) [Carpediemonas membranifera]
MVNATNAAYARTIVIMNMLIEGAIEYGKRIGLGAIPEVVDTFATFFDELSIPPEAVGYALFELKKQNSAKFKSPKCPNPMHTVIPDLLREFHEYMSFCLASYGSASFVYTPEAIGDLQQAAANESIIESASLVVDWARGSFGDHVTTIINAHTTGRSEDILCLSYPEHQEAFRCAYFILDHKAKEEILVCVRGTMSVPDAITDLVASASDFMGGQCHKGMLRTAENIVDEIRDELRRVVAVRGADYPVTITGHSLGASVGSILAMMLKDEFNVRCFAYACPSVFSADLVDRSKEIVTSLATSTDIVPRLSYESVKRLADDVISVLEQADPPSIGHGFQPHVVHRLIHRHLQKKYELMQHKRSRAARPAAVNVEEGEVRGGALEGFSLSGVLERLADVMSEGEVNDLAEIELAPLLPAGRAIRISGLAKADAEALRRGVEAYREAGHPSPQAPGVDEPFPVREILQNPLTDAMRLLAGLNKEYLFAHKVDNESFGKLVVHKSCLIHHHPLVYIRAIEKCIAVQDEIGDYLAASEE